MIRGENALRDKALSTLFQDYTQVVKEQVSSPVNNTVTNTTDSSTLVGLKGDTGLRGLPGLPGQDGVTPIKGVDYFDGANGDDGTPGTPGTKGDKGDPGIQGIPGESGSGVTLQAVKADTDIASAISLKHSNSTDHASGSDNQDISGKVDKITNYSLVANTEISKIHALNTDNQDLSNLVVKVTNKSLVLDTEISKIHSSGSDNQDLSGLQPKETGKGLSANDLTSGLKTSYDAAYTHSGVAHAPSGATVGADWNTNVSNKPTIPAAQVQTDWNAGSGMGQLLNKPTISSARLFANLTAPVVTSGTTEKVLLQLQIPANNAIVGSTYRAWIIGNSSSTGTLIFKVRCGAGGVITDAIGWTAVTSAAQVANARAGFDVLITIRSSTTLKAEGVGYAGAVQLPTYVAAPATSVIAISGTWWISLTVICSSGTFTAQVGNIEEIK